MLEAGTGAGAALLCLTARVPGVYATGVEMEALTGATIAALTIYDMCKSLSHHIRIAGVRLLSKSGGKRQVRARAGSRFRIAA